jgi:hypothetical protein
MTLNPVSSSTLRWQPFLWIVVVIGGAYMASVKPAAQNGTRLPWTQTFDSGNLYAGFDGFANRTGVTVVNQGCQSGMCLRIPIVQGTISENYGEFYFGDHVGRGGPKVEEVWVTVWSKFDPGIVWPNRTHKIVLLNLTDGITSARRYQMMLNVSPQGQYFIERSDIGAWQFSGLGQNVGQPAAVRYGQWDRLKMYIRLNAPGQRDGIARLWVNGMLKLEYTNVDVRGGTSYGINKFLTGSYATELSPSNGVQYIDDITVSQVDPEGSSTLPTAPTNLRIVS